MTAQAVVVSLAVSSLVLGGAGAAAAQTRVCIPGAQVECPCVGGTRSVQVCAPDGASLLPCQCAASPGTSPPPEAPPPTGQPAPGFTLAPGLPPGAPGSIDVSAATPATIIVDGGEVGRAPVRVGDLKPGVHVVGARFDGGGETRKKVRVGAGEPTTIVMEPPASAQAAVWRQGLHLAPAVSVGDTASKYQGFGVSPELGLNYGLSPAVDLRFGGRLMLSQTEIGFIALAGVPVSARFNIGGRFSLGVGGFVGLRNALTRSSAGGSAGGNSGGIGTPPEPERQRETGLAAGPEVFPAILRFGPKRELELGLAFSALFAVTSSSSEGYGEVIHVGITATYLLL